MLKTVRLYVSAALAAAAVMSATTASAQWTVSFDLGNQLALSGDVHSGGSGTVLGLPTQVTAKTYDDVRAYVQQIAADQTELSSSITSHVDDPAVAALLIAKASQATERGVDLIIEASTRLPRLDERLATDVNTEAITLNIRPYQELGAPKLHAEGEEYPAD